MKFLIVPIIFSIGSNAMGSNRPPIAGPRISVSERMLASLVLALIRFAPIE